MFISDMFNKSMPIVVEFVALLIHYFPSFFINTFNFFKAEEFYFKGFIIPLIINVLVQQYELIYKRVINFVLVF